MAASKRKSNAVDAQSTQTTKKKRTSAGATAAVDRPRRGAAKNDSKTEEKEVKPVKAKATKVKSEARKSSTKPSSTPSKATPANTKRASTTTKAKAQNDDSEDKSKARPSVSTGSAHERGPDEACFWLLKAEPETRLEKGIDVKFSIDDLAATKEPEPWDGVRNPTAQKNMRTMRKGDLAFFYHSNCKVPGIAGVMRIVQEHSIDESAFNPAHPYYDPKSSRDKPRWCVVHVEHVRTLDNFIPLKELQKHAGQGEPLKDMQVLRMSRLSVSRVSADEWEYILKDLADVDPKKVEQK